MIKMANCIYILPEFLKIVKKKKRERREKPSKIIGSSHCVTLSVWIESGLLSIYNIFCFLCLASNWGYIGLNVI